ncbi:MAG: hypothetical protein R2793_04260 [Flavobacteriaceae bacterium]
MKKLVFILFVLMGLAIQAQPGDGPHRGNKESREQREDLTPQQRAELKTKKMTLHLDLTEAQQKKVQDLILQKELKRDEMRAQREKGKELTQEEKFALKSKMLDEEIEMKKQLKSILTEEQYTKLEKTKMREGKMRREHPKGTKG